MKHLVLILIFPILLSSAFVSNSYAFVAAPDKDPTLPQISLQLVLRNSQGQLVAYFEPSVLYIRDPVSTHAYLKTLENRTTVTKGNETFYEYKFGHTEGFDHYGQYTQYGLVYNGDSVIVFNNNGYLAEPGDTLDVHWKIISTS